MQSCRYILDVRFLGCAGVRGGGGDGDGGGVVVVGVLLHDCTDTT